MVTILISGDMLISGFLFNFYFDSAVGCVDKALVCTPKFEKEEKHLDEQHWKQNDGLNKFPAVKFFRNGKCHRRDIESEQEDPNPRADVKARSENKAHERGDHEQAEIQQSRQLDVALHGAVEVSQISFKKPAPSFFEILPQIKKMT